MKKTILGVALLASAGAVQAQGMYFGGGISSNDLEGWGENATGFQIFGGYELDMVKLGELKSAIEVGYMDSGEWEEETCVDTFLGPYCVSATAEAKGVWANYVIGYDFSPVVTGIARAGLDFGDDDGFMFGAGLGFNVAPQFEIRAEYVARDHIDSLQANFVYHIK
jgi:hypothetical protein